MGQGDKAAADAIGKVLTGKFRKEDGDTLTAATLSAGQIGDPSLIPALHKCVGSDYWPEKHNAALSLGQLGDRSIGPRMREWLTVKWDENFRGYAAEALGWLKDKECAPELRAALAIEPFAWVREEMRKAINTPQED